MDLRVGSVLWFAVCYYVAWVLLNSVGTAMFGYVWLDLLFC